MVNELSLNQNEDILPGYSDFQNTEFFQTLITSLDSVAEAMLLVDKTWNVKFVNSSACDLFQLKKDQLLNRNIWDIVPEKAKTVFFNEYNKRIVEENKEVIQFTEYVPSLKSWVSIKVIFQQSYNIFILKKDIGYPAFQVMEEYYRILFDDNPDAVCSIDLKGRFLSVNSSFCHLFRINDKELTGKDFLSIVPTKHQQILQEVFETAKSGKAKTVQIDLSNEVGNPFMVMVMAIPIIVNTHILGAYGIIKDITDQQKNIENIEYLNKMNQLIIESVEDGVLGIDRQLNVFMWNDAAERMTGYKNEEFTVKKLKEIIQYFNSTDVELFKKGFSRESKITRDMIIRRSGATFYRKDGTPFLCEYTITPIISEDEILGSVLTFRDVTEKKKSEEMLRESEKLSAVGQLAAGIAHEIRNPLTSLKGFLQLIEINQGGKKEYYDIMRTEFGRIENILNELLILSKPQTNKKSIVDLQCLLNNTITLLNTQAIIKNIEIVPIFPEEKVYINCIEHQIKQVFINIIKNAIEAMDAGGKITVSIEEKGKTVIIRIKDEGCGIPAEELEKIGNPFYTTKESGTGLGLMVTYQIIDEHAGKVEVESEVGVGTSFILSLPMQ